MKYSRVSYIALLALVLVGSACRPETGDTPEQLPETASMTSVPPQATATLPPTETPIPEASATPLPTATTIPLPPEDLSLSPGDLYLYPVPAVYAGDRVSFQMWPYVPENVEAAEVTIHILVDGRLVAEGALTGRSHLSGEAAGIFAWVWDTSGQIGVHQVEVLLDRDNRIVVGDEDPANNQVRLEVVVADPDSLAEQEQNAIWKRAESDCCSVYVVSGTAADRDLPRLLDSVDTAVALASSRLGVEPEQRPDVYFIDRVIGQGGYAGSDIVVSYTDRDYANNALHQVLVHEAVHLLDRQFAPRRISFFAEGVAVWSSGGHYKAEDITHVAAALAQNGLYIPLPELIDNFYPSQHEISYAEAGAFIHHLIDTYGWKRFRDFYADTSVENGESPARAVDRSVQKHFGRSLRLLEAEWLEELLDLWLDASVLKGIQTTTYYYDTMRRYQLAYDPTAHFLKAWLPSPDEVREKGNPADLTRHPEGIANVTLEVMLTAASDAQKSGDLDRANALLDSVNRIMDSGQFIDPFASSFWRIVTAITGQGYEAQTVSLVGDKAVVLATESESLDLTTLHLMLEGRSWILVD